jgi:hypothetical protein
MPNPFFFGGHITNLEQFVGRKAELRRIASLLETAHTGQMQSVSIVGERRIGKSSLLFHLKQTYPQWLSQPACYCFAYIDLQSARHDTLPDLLNGILKALLDCTHPADRAGENALKRLRASSSNDPLTLDHFEKALATLSGELHLCPVICLDEFERLTEKAGEFTNDLYNSWRSLISNSQAAFIIASHKSLPEIATQKGLTSSFFNVFTLLPLGEFTDEEANELVARGKTCDRPFFDDECRRIRKLAGRHPLSLQVACSTLYEAKVKGVMNWRAVESGWRKQVDFAFGRTAWWRTLWRKLNDVLILTGSAVGFLLKRDKTDNAVYRTIGIIVWVIVLLVVFRVIQLPAVQDWLKIMTGAK